MQYNDFSEMQEILKAKTPGLNSSLRISITNLVVDSYRKSLMYLDTMPIKCMWQKWKNSKISGL